MKYYRVCYKQVLHSTVQYSKCYDDVIYSMQKSAIQQGVFRGGGGGGGYIA